MGLLVRLGERHGIIPSVMVDLALLRIVNGVDSGIHEHKPDWRTNGDLIHKNVLEGKVWGFVHESQHLVGSENVPVVVRVALEAEG